VRGFARSASFGLCAALSIGRVLLNCDGSGSGDARVTPVVDAQVVESGIADAGGDDAAALPTFDGSLAPVDAGSFCERFGDAAAICEPFDAPDYMGAMQQVGSGCDVVTLGQESVRYQSPSHSLRASFPALDAGTLTQCFLSGSIPEAKAYQVTFALYLDQAVGAWADVMGLIYGGTRLSVVLDSQNRPGLWRQNGPQDVAGGPLPVGQWMTMGLLVSMDDATVKATLTIDGVAAVTLDYPNAVPWTDPYAGVGLIEAHGDGVPHAIYFDDYAVRTK
jgi:hypothetical protein